MKSVYNTVLVLGLLVLTPTLASAALINSISDPLLTGAAIIEFNEVAVNASNPTINGVSFTGVGIPVRTVDSAFSGQTSPILGNTASATTFVASGVSFDIVFAVAVSAFSVDLAAVEAGSTSMQAYTAGGALLDSYVLPGDTGTTSTWGFGDIGPIGRVRFVTDDFFFTDNLRYVAAPVPEPASVAIFLLGLAGLGARRQSLLSTGA